jgi:hypothetical protein
MRCRAHCAEILNARMCKHCRQIVIEHRVYFGVVGPFCNTNCCEEYLKRSK